MKKLPEDISRKCILAINGDLPIQEFEQWVYSSPMLEDILDEDDYLALISLDYSSKYARQEINKVIEKYIDFVAYTIWNLKNLLELIVGRDDSLPQILSEIYELYCKGYFFLDNLAFGYALPVDMLPTYHGAEGWEELSFKKQEELLGSFFPGVIDEAKKVLDWLDIGKVVPFGDQNDIGLYQYEDNRSEIEKQPTAYKRGTSEY